MKEDKSKPKQSEGDAGKDKKTNSSRGSGRWTNSFKGETSEMNGNVFQYNRKTLKKDNLTIP